MICPKCGKTNRDSANFCSLCGHGLKGQGAGRGSQLPVPANLGVAGGKPGVSPPGLIPGRGKKPSGGLAGGQKGGKAGMLPGQAQGGGPAQAPSPQGLLPVGTLLDRRYEILAHVATGGMGAIYRGQDTRLNVVVAIKEMLDFFQTHEERKYATQRFREEALILADLRHPCIPRVTDNFIENGRYYLTMDFVSGMTAEKLLQERGGGLPQEEVLAWAVQACDVLGYLHSRKPPIIYRDVKPSNLMIREDGTLMLVDFGIARHFWPRKPGTMIGTHGYAPPEQYKGRTEPRSDLYALGATLHHLLTGDDPAQMPFNFKPLRQARPDCSPGLEKILEKALQNVVEMRFTDAGEMKGAFLALRGGSEAAGSPSRPGGISGVPASPPLPLPPGDAQHSFTKARRLAESGKLKKAIVELEKALSLSPAYPEAHSLMGYVLTRLGNAVDALAHLQKAVSMEPGSATAHFYLGKAHARLGNFSEAQKEYQIAGRLNPRLFKNKNQGLLEKIINTILQ